MPFDDGSASADKAQSSAMSLVINYADPLLAAGTAVFGLGLLVLPLLAKLNLLDDADMYSYPPHGETNPRQPMRLFTEAELRQRMGLLSPAYLSKEICMSTDELDEYMNRCEMETTDDEVSRIQKWRDSVNLHLKSLQKRSALAFLGLPPSASDADINKMYKKMALELHPDKGGDPEKFQELQEMKERLNEMDEEDKKGGEDAEDEEVKKEKEQEEEDNVKLPPSERVKKLRMDVHDNTVRLWEKAKKSKDEITGDKDIKCNSQPALNILRQFVDRFVNNEIKTLRYDDAKGAEAKLRKFLKQGTEIIAVAAMHDVQATLTTIAMHFNYRLVARSRSPDIKNRCAALLDAISEVPVRSEAFLKQVEDSLAGQKDRDKRAKEERAQAQREREAKGDLGGEAGAGPRAAGPQPAAAQGGPQPAAGPPAAAARQGAADPFADFDFGEKPEAAAPKPAPGPSAGAGGALPPEVLARKEDGTKVAAAAQKPQRTCWDPDFDHPYAGALKSNGTGIFCRACTRWVATYEYPADVWALGVVTSWAGRFPFADDAQIMGLAPEFSEDLPEGAAGYVGRLLRKAEAGRPGAAEALGHPWLGQPPRPRGGSEAAEEAEADQSGVQRCPSGAALRERGPNINVNERRQERSGQGRGSRCHEVGVFTVFWLVSGRVDDVLSKWPNFASTGFAISYGAALLCLPFLLIMALVAVWSVASAGPARKTFSSILIISVGVPVYPIVLALLLAIFWIVVEFLALAFGVVGPLAVTIGVFSFGCDALSSFIAEQRRYPRAVEDITFAQLFAGLAIGAGSLCTFGVLTVALTVLKAPFVLLGLTAMGIYHTFPWLLETGCWFPAAFLVWVFALAAGFCALALGIFFPWLRSSCSASCGRPT
ncbi:unnamed protein product [Prorocentrum cordatum]|uniref:J domain-containing protein n=1 Tax=Prorocentrum cordatum TaxID=2364126 RepID=A0ABN9SLF8_9DINO|nr:unnamed protein product [Polarella glacialis]